MAQIKIDSTTVHAIKNDDIKASLKHMIDVELSKNDDAVDTTFVDECVNALLELEQDENKGFAVLIPLVSSADYLNRITGRRHWNTLSRKARVAVIAAVFATSTIAANTAVAAITGVDPLKEAGDAIHSKLIDWGLIEDKSNSDAPLTTPIVKEEPTTAPEQEEATVIKLHKAEAKPMIEQINGIDDEDEETTTRHHIEQLYGEDEEDDETTTRQHIEQLQGEDDDDETTTHRKPEPTTTKPVVEPTTQYKNEAVLTSLEAEYGDNFKVDYIYGETLSYDGLTLTANYSDGSKKTVDINDTDHTQSVNMNITADYTLRIIYQKCIVKINITVRPDEETRGSAVCENDEYNYLLTRKGAYITKYKGNEKNIIIDNIDGNTVYAIGASVFEGTNIETLDLPNVTKIFDNAFKNCKRLTVCSTPSAKYIGNSVFEGCEKLQNADAENATEYLGRSAYANSGITSIVLPDGIKTVPEKLCDECAKLVTADIKGATAVGNSAFSDCTALEEVQGTSNIKTVGETAFYGDDKVDFETAPSELESVGTSGFAYCKSLKFGELANLKSFGDFAFMYCSGVTEVTIDNGITVIPQGAFWGTRIKAITLPDGLKRIEQAAFMSTMISKVTIPESVEYIGTRALQTASGLAVTFEGSPEIENAAFFKSSRLKFYAYENSSAIDYAIENEINYEIKERS